MANLKELRNRITSVSSTMQITSAMKLVSAAKLKRAQDAIVQMRPYAGKLGEMLRNVSASLDSSEGVYSREGEVKKALLVVITSNRGLCGAFNANVVKRARQRAQDLKAEGSEVEILAVGKKAFEFFTKHGFSIRSNESAVWDELTYENVASIAAKVMESFALGNTDRVELFYNTFKNAAVQIPTREQFLPVVSEEEEEGESNTEADYIFEPSRAEILEDLIPRSLKTQMFRALLESHAAEHGARMTAMHKATDNARDLQRELKLKYNQARQAAITNEILEIVSGAEALNG